MLNNSTPLDKSALFELLSLRFDKEETKLSQIPNPALLLNAQKAAQKIANAIREKKNITLVGDYDVDGVSSTAIMVDFFKQIPYPLNAVIPNRFTDGYGVSANLLTRIEADLVITVDNGITACEAADICKQRNIDLIITDHHTPPDVLPDAFTIVDPKLPDCEYPFKEICGAQVAWLLLALLKKELQLNIDMRSFLDILSIAIIADVMPLVNINRTLVKEGLKQLMISSRPSSVIIRDFLNKSSISSEDIAFMIAPRLNSAGRLEDASIALDFFTAPTIEKAYKQFELLGQLNDLRKATEAECTKEAMQSVHENDLVIVVSGEHWNEGVVGIVASRLVDRFGKPAIVLSVHDGVAKGSARSIGDVSIYELIKANEHLLTKFGGHKMAAGLGLLEENIEAFRKAINATATHLNPKDFIPKNELIGTIATDEIDFELLDLLEQFEPYGEANLRPRFLIKNAEVVSIKLLGADKTHSKIEIRQEAHERKTLELVAFRTVFEMPENKKITCSYTIAKNEFNNKTSLQLLVNKIY
ncbi:MAG: single-stranded-DNA-specific exonuclease RecJ [Sulfurimonas sp.]|nr:single-stranded-DNA-specific exonuclease RecJ [Sulfurimonas sp.]MBU3938528.1 single-stranded-DNA-specific exonuclease RecJ [bacterium]MBU4024315.1 single-stranded-DNA-specific exonuclease RecJ [bacterium]MBU4059011.1 single-stranded-DNA-specific exonuclease RecJ [bacterium]MBU4109422.1 single-stranded-DNA-specific exonuclease RecJ [bacterium]